jgi:putative transposase
LVALTNCAYHEFVRFDIVGPATNANLRGMDDTVARWRYRLPHWEVAGRPHFVTIRCAGSLPREAIGRVREIHASLKQIEPNSPQFAALQRKYFFLCESYLDPGFGPFREENVAEMTIASLRRLASRTGWSAEEFTLMPNHAHLLLVPSRESLPLKATLRGWKWFVAREANRLSGTHGHFWQSDWFDRWARTDAEVARIVEYIRNNPVKGGLVSQWRDYPWTRSCK